MGRWPESINRKRILTGTSIRIELAIELGAILIRRRMLACPNQTFASVRHLSIDVWESGSESARGSPRGMTSEVTRPRGVERICQVDPICRNPTPAETLFSPTWARPLSAVTSNALVVYSFQHQVRGNLSRSDTISLITPVEQPLVS